MVHVHLYTSLLVTLLALNAYAAPSYNPNVLYRRQSEPFEGPQTIQTHEVSPGNNGGSVVSDCTVTFTPIVVGDENLVREERACTDVFIPAGQPLPPPPEISTTSTVPPESTIIPPPADTTTTVPPAVTPIDPPVVTTSAPPDTTSSPVVETTEAAPTTTEAAPGTTETGAPPVNPAPAPDTTSSGVTGTPVDDAPDSPTGPPVSSPTEPSVTDVPTGSRANNEADPTQSSANVELPGKKFEVVPIGLGVFAGISVIALIVVGLVTYERTKYRKAFRARRLAASGAEMGYGGMSERR